MKLILAVFCSLFVSVVTFADDNSYPPMTKKQNKIVDEISRQIIQKRLLGHQRGHRNAAYQILQNRLNGDRSMPQALMCDPENSQSEVFCRFSMITESSKGQDENIAYIFTIDAILVDGEVVKVDFRESGEP